MTYNRPKGEYKGKEADSVRIDFWPSNAKLTGDGGEYAYVIQSTVENRNLLINGNLFGSLAGLMENIASSSKLFAKTETW